MNTRHGKLLIDVSITLIRLGEEEFEWQVLKGRITSGFFFGIFLFLFLSRIIYFSYPWVLLCMSVYQMSIMPHGGQNMVPNCLKLELWMIVGCHVGVVKWIQVVYKNSQCSKLLWHLPISDSYFCSGHLIITLYVQYTWVHTSYISISDNKEGMAITNMSIGQEESLCYLV